MKCVVGALQLIRPIFIRDVPYHCKFVQFVCISSFLVWGSIGSWKVTPIMESVSSFLHDPQAIIPVISIEFRYLIRIFTHLTIFSIPSRKTGDKLECTVQSELKYQISFGQIVGHKFNDNMVYSGLFNCPEQHKLRNKTLVFFLEILWNRCLSRELSKYWHSRNWIRCCRLFAIRLKLLRLRSFTLQMKEKNIIQSIVLLFPPLDR